MIDALTDLQRIASAQQIGLLWSYPSN